MEALGGWGGKEDGRTRGVWSWSWSWAEGVGGKYGEGKRLLNDKGQWEVGDDAWGLLGLVWPKPGMFILDLILSWGEHGG